MKFYFVYLLITEVEFNEDTDGFLVDKPADVYLDDLMLGAYSGLYLFLISPH